jgi:16S rRNA (cytosine967-C5)-methyltransferase
VPHEKSGIASRRLGLSLLEAVLLRGETLDEALDAASGDTLGARDRAFAHAMAAAVLRRKGEAEAEVRAFVPKPLPKSSGPAHLILLLGVAQLLFLRAPAHAVIDLSVTLALEDPRARHFAKLVNAVLRKVATDGEGILADLDQALINTPSWLMKRWIKAYGEETAREIVLSHLSEASVDLSVKSDPAAWAERLGGTLLPTGSVRLAEAASIESLAGFKEGQWWVQDAAAALPVLLIGNVTGKRVLDLCAAPGGKTAQLAARGAQVTAVDVSASRLARLKDNLKRLGLIAELREADFMTMAPDAAFDAVLLDAPCSATGTIRRHPDLPHIKSAAAVAELAGLQARMLDHAAHFVSPGGLLVYCACSLQPEEGEMQAEGFLERKAQFVREPISAGEIGEQAQFINQKGNLRTLPFMPFGTAKGLDGFFAARFRRYQFVNHGGD